MIKFVVFDMKTGLCYGIFQTRTAARRKADKKDLEYGAIRYGVREVVV